MNTATEDRHSSNREQSNGKGNRSKYFLILLAGVLLHMVFAGENLFFNYVINTWPHPDAPYSGEMTLGGLAHGLYGTFAYAGAGIIASLVVLGPIVHFMTPKRKRHVMKSAAYGVCFGVLLRISSYWWM